MRNLLTAPVFVAALLIVPSPPASGQRQPPRRDPVMTQAIELERNGRLQDAEKLLESTTQAAESQTPVDGKRIHNLRVQLSILYARMGRKDDAIAIGRKMLDEDEKASGENSYPVWLDLGNLGLVYEIAGKEDDAGKTFERQLAISRANHDAGLLMSIANVSGYYLRVNRTEDAKALLTEAVQICDSNPEPQFPDCSGFRTQLADIYRKEGRAGYADQIVAQGANETVGKIKDWLTQVGTLNAQARQEIADGSYSLAEADYQKAIAVIRQAKYLRNPGDAIADEQIKIGQLYEKEGNSAGAEQVYKQIFDSRIQAASPLHAEIARSLSYCSTLLQNIYRSQGRFADMEMMLQQVISIQERDLGTENTNYLMTLTELAKVYTEEKRYSDADPLYSRAITIEEKIGGPDDPRLPYMLSEYAVVLRKLGEIDQANSAQARVSELWKKIEQDKKSAAH
jgi:tetratricopeptide (TPR) repeat protein